MPAKTLMIQGTGSHVGKTVLVAALCRLFVQQGLRVAPFKAQNMSNNSCVTPDGKEISRAQALQAAACRLAPRVTFNPVLIKPSGEETAQLVVNGVVAGQLQAKDFGRLRREHSRTVQVALDTLRDEFDLIVIEGAGSPAEVNLRDMDIVNMFIARYAQAPVVLVGDIDRGGVLASLVGTGVLLEEEERRHIKGFLINKFRGHQAILDPGITIVEERLQTPCLGVIPFYRGLDLPQEDGLEWERFQAHVREKRPDRLRIGIVNVPCVSNFTDFDGLLHEPDVEICKIESHRSELVDLLIFPGTKQTGQALEFVKVRKIDHFAKQVLEAGGSVVGVCGGFQLLGETVSDPHQIESTVANRKGLGLLSVTTVFAPIKVTRQVSGHHEASGLTVGGYEVHMGHTTLSSACMPLIRLNADHASTCRWDGASRTDGRVWGTYLHGLFDNPAFRRHVLNDLRRAKSWPPVQGDAVYSLDQALDQWADHVGRAIDQKKLHEIIDSGMRFA